MLKMGGFYITAKGRLVKLFNEFTFADGYNINAALCDSKTGTWTAVRYKPDGTCNAGAENNILPDKTHSSYLNYLTYQVWFDLVANCWRGRASDPYGAIIVDQNNLDGFERAMKLIILGAEQKLLTFMKDAGYDEETDMVDAE